MDDSIRKLCILLMTKYAFGSPRNELNFLGGEFHLVYTINSFWGYFPGEEKTFRRIIPSGISFMIPLLSLSVSLCLSLSVFDV